MFRKKNNNSPAIDSKKILKQQKALKVVSKSFTLLFLTVMAIIIVVPFYWMLNTSFKTSEEVIQNPPTLYPHEWTFDNYKVAFLGQRRVKINQYQSQLDNNPGIIAENNKFIEANKVNYEEAKKEVLAATANNTLYSAEYEKLLTEKKPYLQKLSEIDVLVDKQIRFTPIVVQLEKDLAQAKKLGNLNLIKSVEESYNTKDKELQEVNAKVNALRKELKESKQYNDLLEREKVLKSTDKIYTPSITKKIALIEEFEKKTTETRLLQEELNLADGRLQAEIKTPDDSFKVYIFNTLIVGISSTIIGTFMSIIGAFALSRLNFKGRDLVFSIMLATMMIPGEMMVISNYITVTKLGWTDNAPLFNGSAYLAMVVPFLVTVFHIYLLRQNFKQIPNELYYAAKVDGTSDWGYLWKIMVPLAKSSIITITILKLMGTWNAYIWPNLVAGKHKLITVWLRSAFNDLSTGRVQLEQQMAATVLVLLPLLFVFIFLRKYIMRGVSRGGTKG